MLNVTPGYEQEYEHIRASLAASEAVSAILAATEPQLRMPRRPLPSWLGASRRQPIAFPARPLLRRPA